MSQPGKCQAVSDLRESTRAYLVVLTAITAGVAVVAMLQTSRPAVSNVIMAMIFCGLQALALSFPIQLAPQQRFSLHTSVVFAAVLLFDPGTAMLIAGIGTLIAEVVRHQPSEQVLFNVSQTALQAGLAGLLLTLVDLPEDIVPFNDLIVAIAVVVAALMMELIDVATVEIVVRLETDQPLLSIFRQVPAGIMLDDLSQFAFGLLAAVCVSANPYLLSVVVLLAYQLHLASSRSLAAQRYERLLRAESERTANARREFLITASHELKTPITSVKMAAQLLDRAVIQRQSAFRADESSIRRWRDQLLLGIERLEKLVTGLLDATRIQEGRLELRPEPMDLVVLARAVLERFEQAPERTASHRLTLSAPDRVEGIWDVSTLDQVLTNLLSNALKYSPHGGDVKVLIRPMGDDVLLQASDTGIGISAEQLGELFRPFVRGVDPRHGIGGTGLGLYITKRIVEQHHGTITIESVPNIRTTVTVTLPRTPANTDGQQDQQHDTLSYVP
jgi:signal transduction histidine kinase